MTPYIINNFIIMSEHIRFHLWQNDEKLGPYFLDAILQ